MSRMTPEDLDNLRGRIKAATQKRLPIHRPREKRNKYGAQKTIFDGIRFDSKSEAKRYAQLKAMEQAGAIRDLKLQTQFEIFPEQTILGKRIKACFYRCDFDYIDSNGERVIEDVKSSATMTREYKIKAKGMAFFHGVVVREVIM